MELGLALTLCALGSAFLLPALILTLAAENRKRKCTCSTQAVVVEIKGRSSGDGLSFYPVYQYEAEGTVYRGKGAARTRYIPRQGEKIAILYDPRCPRRSYIKGYDDKIDRVLSLCFGVMGAIPILICLGIALLK